MSSSRSTRSSISPFRSRLSAPAPPPPARASSGGRPSTPSSTASARPTTPSSTSAGRLATPSAAFARPTTPSSSARPATPSSTASARPTTPSSVSSRAAGRAPLVDAANAKENIMVTVRFRPLSPREINKGDEVAWYADGDNMVRNEYNPSIAYAFDKVFGPATTTRHVYDVAAQHVVSGAMQGINGTVFAYGVTSSGKTHTMHVINDLLDPTGQNLRIREDAQGTYVEGIKEEVVLSPAHALSLIATGEEHRHVGSNNFNLVSSRSHTIFTLTIESSPSGESDAAEEVKLSQLNLIDLAGSESSKTETTGLRRKEGSYINKSLLTLGTVISKLTDGKATHIPYRDSKLTRLLQSSLSGHGRISLICTVTPASSNSEETHNTLKFAHRSKHVEIKASQNKLAYLPDRKREYFVDDDDISLDSELSLEGKLDSNNPDESARFDRRNRKRGMLGWFKLKKSDQLSGLSSSVDGDSNASGSPSCSKSSQQKNLLLDLKDGRRKSMTRKGDDPTLADSFLERTQAGDLFSAASRARHPLPSGTTIVDQIDLLQEQVKMLAGEVALCSSSLKRLSEQAANNPDDVQIQEQIEKLKDEITEKKSHIHLLEQRMVQSLETKEDPATKTELSQTFSKLSTQLSEKTFELEIMSADNRILQDQLHAKVTENAELQETVAQLRQEISSLKAAKSEDSFASVQSSEPSTASTDTRDSTNDISNHTNMPSRTTEGNESGLFSQVLKQASEIESLKQEKLRLAEEKDGLEIHSQKLAEESSYAKELASAAAVELKNLAEEVTRLSYENAKLNADLAAAKEQTASVSRSNIHNDAKQRDHENGILVEELQKELVASCQREAVLEDTLSQKDRRESDLLKVIDDAKCREHELENELASMWVLVSKIKKESSQEDVFEFKSKQNGFHSSKSDSGRVVSEMQASDNRSWDGLSTIEEARAAYNFERRRCKELESAVSRLKGEDLRGLDVKVLEELQNFHVEALSRICQEKMASQVL
ncbi:Kinesin-like protein KIN-7E, chloroplastic [Dichanthelium oligosanthes]|uniref:Kinesin-like protein n=1 Tax=Dichanthelium oligosanthes TaxID=888268 RepID=A0A1E5VKB0_9POAL|nr:Kinesin-like protein KIN-7E, chloroplastic [Dichanthelium oligosanthes]